MKGGGVAQYFEDNPMVNCPPPSFLNAILITTDNLDSSWLPTMGKGEGKGGSVFSF